MSTQLVLDRLKGYNKIEISKLPSNLDQLWIAVTKQFDKDTNCVPFLTDTQDRIIKLYPPEFYCEYLVLPSKVQTLVSIVRNGTALTSSQFMLEEECLDRILIKSQYNSDYPFVITARLGMYHEYPEDVLYGLVSKACSMVLRQYMGVFGNPTSIQEDTVDLEFDAVAGRSEVDRLDSEYQNIVRLYERYT